MMKRTRKHLFHLNWPLPQVLYFVLTFQLLVFFMIHVACAADWDSSEILQLQGPRNVSVERGATAQIRCRLLVAKSTDSYRSSPQSNLRFVPWKAKANQGLNVQWIVDGFGFTNESLMESFEGRYLMPGPLNEGIFDLYVHNARSSDQTIYSCQVTVQTFQTLRPPRVKTLTSSTVYVTVYSPPEKLKLRQLPPSSSQQGEGVPKHYPDRIQSDNPSFGDFQSFHINDGPPSLAPPSTQHQIQHSKGIWDVVSRKAEEIWAVEDEEITLECSASPSYPASRLMWILSSESDFESEIDLQPSFNFEDFSEQTRATQRLKKYPKWRFVFAPREGPQLGYKLQNKETPDDSESGLMLGTSAITLRMDKSLSGRRIECLVQNAAAFEQSIMPKIAATLQVLYIDNMSITTNRSRNDYFGGYFRENEVARFFCAASSNPKTLRYIWTLTDPSETFLGSGVAESKERQHTGLKNVVYSSFQLDPREREIGIGATLDLQMTAQMHKQILRCWVTPDTGERPGGSKHDFTELPVWKQKSLLLLVSFDAKLIGPEEDLEAASIGQSVQLTCQVEANPPAKVTWYQYRGVKVVNADTVARHPNTSGLYTPAVITHRLLRSFLTAELNSHDFKKLVSNERYAVLAMEVTSPEVFGIYICVGLAGQREVRKVTALAESGPPKIEPSTVKLSGVVGQSGRVSCEVVALPRPTPHEFLWTRIAPEGSASALVLPSEGLNIEHEEKLTGALSHLTFSKISIGHFGTYNCTVITPYGADSAIIVFSEKYIGSYAFAIAIGVTIVVAAILIAVLIWILRHHIIRRRGGENARIITANHVSSSPTPNQYDSAGQCSAFEVSSLSKNPISNHLSGRPDTGSMQLYASLPRNTGNGLSEPMLVYKHQVSTNNSAISTPRTTRGRQHPTDSTSTLSPVVFFTTAPNLATSPQTTGVVDTSQITLLADCTPEEFQSHVFSSA